MRYNVHISLCFVLLMLIATPLTWAQHKPNKENTKLNQYTWQIIAKKTGKQPIIIDGVKIKYFNADNFTYFILADSGDIIWSGKTDTTSALFKNKHAVAYHDKSISGYTIFRGNSSENFGVGLVNDGVSNAGDIMYAFSYLKGDSYYPAIAVNDKVVYPTNVTGAGVEKVVRPTGESGFTSDNKYAIELFVIASPVAPNTYGPVQTRWLVDGTLQKDTPKGLRGYNDPPLPVDPNIALSSNRPSIPIDLNYPFQRFLGAKTSIMYEDSTYTSFANVSLWHCKFSANHKGQIAMLLSSDGLDLFPGDPSDLTQVLLLATPTNAPSAPADEEITISDQGQNVDAQDQLPFCEYDKLDCSVSSKDAGKSYSWKVDTDPANPPASWDVTGGTFSAPDAQTTQFTPTISKDTTSFLFARRDILKFTVSVTVTGSDGSTKTYRKTITQKDLGQLRQEYADHPLIVIPQIVATGNVHNGVPDISAFTEKYFYQPNDKTSFNSGRWDGFKWSIVSDWVISTIAALNKASANSSFAPLQFNSVYRTPLNNWDVYWKEDKKDNPTHSKAIAIQYVKPGSQHMWGTAVDINVLLKYAPADNHTKAGAYDALKQFVVPYYPNVIPEGKTDHVHVQEFSVVSAKKPKKPTSGKG